MHFPYFCSETDCDQFSILSEILCLAQISASFMEDLISAEGVMLVTMSNTPSFDILGYKTYFNYPICPVLYLSENLLRCKFHEYW